LETQPLVLHWQLLLHRPRVSARRRSQQHRPGALRGGGRRAGGGARAAGRRLQQLELALLHVAGIAALAVLVEDRAAPALDQRLGRAPVCRGLVRQLAQEEHHLASRRPRDARARAQAAATAPGTPRQRRTLRSDRAGP